MRASQSIWNPQGGWKETAPSLNGSAKLVLAFGSPSAFTQGARWSELRERHPNSILLGCSTGGEICGPDVSDEALSVTALDFEHTRIASAESDLDDSGDSFSAGKHIGDQLAGPGLSAIFVLSDGTRVNGSELVRGLRASVGENVVLTGGLAGDGPRFGTTYVGLNAPPAPGKIAAVGFYGDALKVGHGSSGGWDVFGPERKITRAEANVLYELDGQPALDLYKRYLGEDADGLPGSALFFPLRIYPADKPDQAIVRTIVGVDEAAKTMIFAGDMPVGFSAQLMRGNFDRLIEGAANAAEQAKGGHDDKSVAILVSCIGRKLLLGQRIREEVEAVQDVLGSGTLVTGFYSYGEVCPHAVTGHAELHNQTMTITTLSESGGA
ncbi:MAG: hypothetical protein GC166_11575 [Alphaproteobacteria bacterium]|nr:hypothetical protein [Alphaproteobacteria bacterium]